MARALYRSRQVFHSFKRSLTDAETASVQQVLSPAEAALFFAMERRDQRHALEVSGRLHLAGWSDPSLLKAALLHDCGKGRVSLWLRVLRVLRPSLVDSLAAAGSSRLNSEAYRLVNHAALGAERAGEAGAGGTTLNLIACLPLPEEEHLFYALLEADDAS